MINSPDVWSVGVGHKDTDIITLVRDGNVRFNGSWKYNREGRNDANVHKLQNALAKKRKPQNQKCKAASHREHEINVNLGRKHTFEYQQKFFPLS